MKKLINDPADVVVDALRGVAAAHPQLRVDLENRIVVRGDAPVQGHVGVISGGGSGHEPLHGGFVGPGMLDAAVAGEVFTSPTPDQITAATTAVAGGAGRAAHREELHGRRAQLPARRRARRRRGHQGRDRRSSTTTSPCRTASTPPAAAAPAARSWSRRSPARSPATGADLDEVAAIGRRANQASRSFGIALTPCIVPAAGTPTFELGPDEIEIGIGIHGEPGRERRPIGPASELAAVATQAILDDGTLDRGDEALVIVNGMGGTPLIELYLVFGEVAKLLGDRGITVARRLVGNYVTSLEMAGCMLTLTKLDADLTRLWDAPVNTPGLHWGA